MTDASLGGVFRRTAFFFVSVSALGVTDELVSEEMECRLCAASSWLLNDVAGVCASDKPVVVVGEVVLDVNFWWSTGSAR